jgi:hypothetical protein
LKSPKSARGVGNMAILATSHCEDSLNCGKKAVLGNSCSYDGASDGALIVIMEATKSAQEDLKSIMDGGRLINHNKEHFRIR